MSKSTGKGLVLFLGWCIIQSECLSPELTESCRMKYKPVNHTEIESIKTVEGVTKTLHEAVTPLTWCDAYQACAKAGLSLATYPDRDSQKTQKGFQKEYIEMAWIGGKRKAIGANWTWVDSLLENFNSSTIGEKMENDLDDNKHPWAYLWVMPSSKRDFKNDQLMREFVLCNNTFTETITKEANMIDWHDAQNTCVLNGGRLATYNDVIWRETLPSHNYWIGLYYRPWIWVVQGKPSQPILYSSFVNHTFSTEHAEGKECLALIGAQASKWTSKPCHEKTKLFICQDNKRKEFPIPMSLLYAILVIGGIFIILVVLISVMIYKSSNKPGAQYRPSCDENVSMASAISTRDMTVSFETTPQDGATGIAQSRCGNGVANTAMMKELKGVKLFPREKSVDELYYESIRESSLYQLCQ